MKKQSPARDFFRLFGPLAALVLLVAVSLAWLEMAAETRRQLAEQSRTADVAATAVAQSLAPVMAHLRSLSQERPMRAAFEAAAPEPAALDGMAQALTSLLQRNPPYMQARWIDRDGRERVRIDAAPGQPRRAPEPDLQQKLDRYYVAEVLALPAGTLYASALDLNVEHGVVEQPRRPMFRAAIRVDDATGRSAGLIVVNVDGQVVLGALDYSQDVPGAERLLVNSRGDFLRGPTPDDEFAFMFGRSVTLDGRAPQVWAGMQAQPIGAMASADALWAWRKVDPTPDLMPAQGRRNATPWFVVVQRSEQALHKAQARIAGVTIVVAALVLAVIATLAWRLAREKFHLAAARYAAESATRSKAEFLANMSHEIRTPINAIIGLTYLMQRDAQTAAQHERLAKVDTAANHLLQVINDVLDLSKVDAGKMILEQVDFSLDELIKAAVDMVAAQAQTKGLELVVDTDHLPDNLRGDPTRLAQALINLLSNAVKFTSQGWVRIRAEKLAEQGQRLQVRFEVTDTGPGIPAARQAILFDAFEQADASTTRHHGGSGLGLALTRHLARLMGGDVGLDTAAGAGSRFWFTAWLAHGSGTQPRPRESALRGLRALLVDDLPEALAALDARLTSFGLQVDALDNGEAALQRAQGNALEGKAYDVILLDWRMAPRDGMQTLRDLRQFLGTATPPSILITAFDEAGLRQRAESVGFDDVLIKPITASALHDALTKLLKQPGSAPRAAHSSAERLEVLMKRQHGGQRVLLVEDNAVNREVASEILRAAGLQVDIAEDGAQGVELALAHQHDLILMDVQMPVMDGLEATRAIRRHPGAQVPIIAMTANAFSDDRAACLAAGMNDHVAKPVDLPKFYATLQRWLPARADAGTRPVAAQDAVAASAALRAPLLARLDALEGFDLAGHLGQIDLSPAVVARILQTFVDSYRAGAPALGHAGSAQERARCAASCHSVRSACASIGATAMAEQLADFEAALASDVDGGALEHTGAHLHGALMALVARLDLELA